MINDSLNTDEAARFLGIRAGTLAVWRQHRRGPRYLKLGGLVRYRRTDLWEFLRAGLVTPKSRVTRKRRSAGR